MNHDRVIGGTMSNKKVRILVSVMVSSILLTSINMDALTRNFYTKVSAAENNGGNNQLQEEDYTQYVNPFVGTDVDYGQLFPGAVSPNGLVKLSPDTYPHNTDDHAGYDYSKSQT